MNLQVGDKFVAPGHGVVEYVATENTTICGTVHVMHVLAVFGSGEKLLIPQDKLDLALRPLTSEGDLKEIYNLLRELSTTTSTIDIVTWNRKLRGFMEKIKTGSLFEVAEVYRDLYRLKNRKTLSFGERRTFDMVRRLIVVEISVIKQKPEDRIERELDKLMGG